MMQVLFVSRCESASWIRCSFSMSVKLVASSNTMMGASFKMARAMHTRCRSPPDSLTPFSPSNVS